MRCRKTVSELFQNKVQIFCSSLFYLPLFHEELESTVLYIFKGKDRFSLSFVLDSVKFLSSGIALETASDGNVLLHDFATAKNCIR